MEQDFVPPIKKYCIKWYAPTGATGQGQAIFSSYELAKAVADKLNHEWDGFTHSVVESDNGSLGVR